MSKNGNCRALCHIRGISWTGHVTLGVRGDNGTSNKVRAADYTPSRQYFRRIQGWVGLQHCAGRARKGRFSETREGEETHLRTQYQQR